MHNVVQYLQPLLLQKAIKTISWSNALHSYNVLVQRMLMLNIFMFGSVIGKKNISKIYLHFHNFVQDVNQSEVNINK